MTYSTGGHNLQLRLLRPIRHCEAKTTKRNACKSPRLGILIPNGLLPAWTFTRLPPPGTPRASRGLLWRSTAALTGSPTFTNSASTRIHKTLPNRKSLIKWPSNIGWPFLFLQKGLCTSQFVRRPMPFLFSKAN